MANKSATEINRNSREPLEVLSPTMSFIFVMDFQKTVFTSYHNKLLNLEMCPFLSDTNGTAVRTWLC